MINFSSFADELVKIAQYDGYPDPNRKGKVIGGLAGAGLGAAAGSRSLKGAGKKVRIAAALTGALLGGLGGREVGEGTQTAGRGLRMTAQQTRYALQ